MVLLIGFGSCKSSKKAAEAARAAAEKAQVEQDISNKKQQDEAEQTRQAAEAQAKLDAESKRQSEVKESTPYVRLNQYFEAIATSGSVTSNNNSIQEALAMFASAETPVLIIISGSGSQKDFDRPTTIKNYLNYLKDQKKNNNQIENLEFDNSGKITAVELRKN